MRRAKPRQESAEQMLERIGQSIAAAGERPSLLRYRPHEKQKIFHALSAKHRLFLGGNRSGKSVGGTTEGLMRARGQHPWRPVPPAPTRGRVIGTDFANGIEQVLLPLWGQWTPPSMLINGSWEDSYHDGRDGKILTLANGSTVQFMSYEQSVGKFAGASLHWVHFDEEPPKDIYDESRARVIDTDGDWWMTLTPVLGLDYIYDEVYLPGKRAMEHPELLQEHEIDAETGLPLFGVVEVESYDNLHLKKTALDGFFSTLTEEGAQTRRSGAFVQISGSVFPDFSPSEHVIPDVFTPRVGYHRIYVSIDNGWRDETAVLWHAVDPHDNVTTFDELYVKNTLIRDVVAQVKMRNTMWGITAPFIYVGDPTSLSQKNQQTGMSNLQEFARHGMPIATKGVNRDVEFGVRRMTQYLRARRDPQNHGVPGNLEVYVGDDGVDGGPIYEPRISFPKWLVTERCPNLARQLEKNRWKRRPNRVDEATLNKLTSIQDKDNHATDSARFFFVLMPDLAPHETTASRQDREMHDLADTLGAVKPASRRDPKFGGWSYRAVQQPAHDYDGWED